MNPLRCKRNITLASLLTGLLTLSQGLLLMPGWSVEPPRLLAKTGPIIPQATATARAEQKHKQIRQVRPENYDLTRHPVTDAQESHWRNILWTTALVAPPDPFVAKALNDILALSTRSGLSRSQVRTVDMAFQVGTQLYLNYPDFFASIGQQFLQTVQRSPDPQWVAIALAGLAKSQHSPNPIDQLSTQVRQRFPQWSQSIALRTTLEHINEQLSPAPAPPLKDLLSWVIAPGQMQLYVICSRDRNDLCLSILKNRQGQFVRETNSTLASTGSGLQQNRLWSVPLLLQSIHNLDWNFTRGETPQGIYRIEGTVPQPDYEFFRAYGQFPLVNLYVPFEAGAQSFLPGRSGPFAGSLQAYQALLPPSWRNYSPLQQSYWAGRLGRGLFRIHGSGEAPDFFSKVQRNPSALSWNPTLGCLSALELYNATGQLQQSDMPKMLQTLTAVGGKNFSGYLIVVEVPNVEQKPISLEDIEATLR